jgi:hypothetical protein
MSITEKAERRESGEERRGEERRESHVRVRGEWRVHHRKLHQAKRETQVKTAKQQKERRTTQLDCSM